MAVPADTTDAPGVLERTPPQSALSLLAVRWRRLIQRLPVGLGQDSNHQSQECTCRVKDNSSRLTHTLKPTRRFLINPMILRPDCHVKKTNYDLFWYIKPHLGCKPGSLGKIKCKNNREFLENLGRDVLPSHTGPAFKLLLDCVLCCEGIKPVL